MTKKDYEAIARSIKLSIEREIVRIQRETNRAVTRDNEYMMAFVSGQCACIAAMCQAFANDNPKFQVTTFVKACGIDLDYYIDATA